MVSGSHTVYLALGSNVGDSRAHIKRAMDLLGSQLQNIKRAPVYASKAVGYTEQADFLNTAISGGTKLSPEALLGFIKAIEQQVGRTATFHWGPREIDIDIIFYDDEKFKTSELTIPHLTFRDRDFVLQPLCDLNPDLIDPLSGQTVQALLNDLKPEQRSLR